MHSNPTLASNCTISGNLAAFCIPFLISFLQLFLLSSSWSLRIPPKAAFNFAHPLCNHPRLLASPASARLIHMLMFCRSTNKSHISTKTPHTIQRYTWLSSSWHHLSLYLSTNFNTEDCEIYIIVFYNFQETHIEEKVTPLEKENNKIRNTFFTKNQSTHFPIYSLPDSCQETVWTKK